MVDVNQDCKNSIQSQVKYMKRYNPKLPFSAHTTAHLILFDQRQAHQKIHGLSFRDSSKNNIWLGSPIQKQIKIILPSNHISKIK